MLSYDHSPTPGVLHLSSFMLSIGSAPEIIYDPLWHPSMVLVWWLQCLFWIFSGRCLVQVLHQAWTQPVHARHCQTQALIKVVSRKCERLLGLLWPNHPQWGLLVGVVKSHRPLWTPNSGLIDCLMVARLQEPLELNGQLSETWTMSSKLQKILLLSGLSVCVMVPVLQHAFHRCRTHSLQH